MSVTRLLVSGLLVASGLVLAAFTLHGAFDARQVQASSGPTLKPWSTDIFGAGGRRVVTSTDAPEPAPKAMVTEASPKLNAKASMAPSAATADAKVKKKKRTEKRQTTPVEEAQKTKQQQSQQASLQWPWSWFSK
jgi:hypothetical protein